jgi:hypothetical protein
MEEPSEVRREQGREIQRPATQGQLPGVSRAFVPVC